MRSWRERGEGEKMRAGSRKMLDLNHTLVETHRRTPVTHKHKHTNTIDDLIRSFVLQ